MKVVGFIPFLLGYQGSQSAVSNRIMRKLGGRYIINYSIDLLNRSKNIFETVVFSSNPNVLEYIEDSLEYTFLKRDELLDAENVTIDEIIAAFLNKTDADVVVLLHPNSPFLSIKTLDECIKKVVFEEYDSAFVAYEFRKFSWFNGSPLNYSFDAPTPKPSEIKPVFIELSSLYVFTREAFEIKHKRIGEKPYMCCINHFEGHEANSPEDHDIAELMVNSGLYLG